jgi:nitrogen-specific signal transduction histidine kinase/CheY-like chemotaxis protein
VTVRLEAERQRHELETRMQEAQRLESLGVLAGGVAHDFNNLLAAIMGNTEFLRERAAGDPELACHVDEIATATERAADLCRQLLAYSGRRTLARQPLDLTRLVEDSSRLLGITVPRKVELVLDLAPGLPAVAGDASQLRQVVVNLAVNAAEALGAVNAPGAPGDGAGVVRVRTGVVTLDRAGVRRLVHGDQPSPGTYVFLEVEDDGCGMSEEVRGRIFEPFYSTKFTGRGLGLAAVRGIVRGHGGAFELESAPGCGTRIRVLFPALSVAVGPEEAPAPECDDWRGEGAVLLADDEPAPRGITARLLAAIGFDPVLAAGGPEAVRRFEEDPGRFRLAVLDVVMPGLDGPGVCRRLRELAPGLPVLFISGYDEDGLQGELAIPATAFLQKPFKLHDLRGRLRRLYLSRG